MTSTPQRALYAIVVALSGLGCFAGRSHLIGFPKVEGKDPSETADLMYQIALNTEAEMHRVLDEGSTDPHASRPQWQKQGAFKLFDEVIAMGADELGPQTGLPPQGTRTRRKPLFLRPRSTCPALIEASRVSSDPSDERREWIIPIWLNRKALERSTWSPWILGEALSAIFLPHPGYDLPLVVAGPELLKAIQEKLNFVLVSRDRFHPVAIPLIRDVNTDIGAILKSKQEEDVLSGRDDIMHWRADALEIVLRLPTEEVEARWKSIQDAEPGSGLRREELFDLRVFPRIRLDLGAAREPWRSVLEAIADGRWVLARNRLADLLREFGNSSMSASELGLDSASAEALASALEARSVDLHCLAPELEPVMRHASRLADILEREPVNRAAALARVRDLELSIEFFVDDDSCPAPVLLDEPRPVDRTFSFIVAADLQYDTDGSNLFNFLTMFDPAVAPITASAAAEIAKLSDEIRKQVYSAKFALIVGDFGDGKGMSSSTMVAVTDAFGLNSPSSPYAEHLRKGRGEFPELREQIRRSSKPIYVVPGNHDGFVSYGGVFNQIGALLGYGLECIPLVSPAGQFLENEAGDLPTIVRLLRITPPFYDGLVDWSYELGPRNVAFNYRGCAFVAANSFDLHQLERDQVGALGNNWGGGLQDASLVWIDVALRHFSNLDRKARGLPEYSVPGTSFLFMHHDPRGSIASKNGFRELYFGRYNDITSPVNELTFGYLGFSWATITGVWIPIISPIATDVLAEASYGENFQERWMRTTAWDESCYNAKGLLEVVNRNLDGAPPIRSTADGSLYSPARISTLFFGHDDTPVIGKWLQPGSNSVFSDYRSDEGWDTFKNNFQGIWRRSQSEGPPSWAKTMAFDDGRQANVIRMDDLGDVFSKVNGHGFHLVTVKFPKEATPGAKPEVVVFWIPIPR